MNDIITIDGVKYKRVDTVVDDKAKTGYERVSEGEKFYSIDMYNDASEYIDYYMNEDDDEYTDANYYSDKTIAENNARADMFKRKLRRWQALNDEPVDWNDTESDKYLIFYKHDERKIDWDYYTFAQEPFNIYFSSQEKAEEAIEEFRDELLWYFTEYQSRLDEPKRGGQEVNT